MASILMRQLEETISFIRTEYSATPKVGIILGSGLGNLVQEIEIEKEISYSRIPNFPVSTVEGHSGKLIFGRLSGQQVVVMAGRFHFYEGYTPQQVAFPVRVMKMLGVATLLLSNAAGGVHPDFGIGDLMIIKDHISLFTINPLLGANEDELGPRFPDMSEPYAKTLIAKAKIIGEKLGYHLKEGVYTGVTGPTFETHAEYRLIKAVGGDAVGMSTVQEVIAARHAGITVFAISVITDLGIRDEENTITHEEVLAAAKEAEPKLTMLFKEMVAVI
jgi:purine-nucleoside phosphorylase